MASILGASKSASLNQVGTQLLDLTVSSSANGVTIPIGYGTCALGANIIWSPGLVEHSTTTTVSSKGGPTTTSTQYTYTVSFAAAAGEGPGTILKIWGDAQVLFDQSGHYSGYQGDFTNTVIYSVGMVVKYNHLFWILVTPYATLPAPTPGSWGGWNPYTGTPIDIAGEQQYPSPTLYSGTDTQMPDSTIQANLGVNFTSAFRGLIYAVWDNLAVTNFGNRVPNIRMLVTFGNPAGSPPALTGGVDYIVADLCKRCGIDSSLIAVDDLVPVVTTTPADLVDLPAVGLLTGGVLSFYQYDPACGSPFLFTYPGDGTNRPLKTPKSVYHLKANQTLMMNPYPATVLPGWTNATGNTLLPMTICGAVSGGAGPATWDGTATVPFTPGNVGSYAQANWDMTFVGQLSISVPGTYTFQCSHQGGVVVGIGGGAVRVSGPLTNPHVNMTKTAAKGYPIVMANNFGDYNPTPPTYPTDSFVVTFPAVGNYGLEVDYGCHITNRTLSLGWMMSGQLSPLLPISGTAGADPITEAFGYVITNQKDGRSLIGELESAFFFDSVESDFKLKFIRRGVHQSVITIPEDDLGLVGDNKKLTETITQAQDAPQTVTVLYIDPSLDYQQGTQQKRRSSRVVTTRNQTSLNLPLVMSQTEARQIAEKTLYSTWMERLPYQINLWKAVYALLDPTDVADFIFENVSYQQRINTSSIGQNYAIQMDGVSHLAAAYASAVGGATSSGTVVVVLTVGATAVYMFDLPYFQDTDASLNRLQTGIYWFLVSSDSTATSWPGGVLLQSPTGSSYATLGSSSTSPDFGVTSGTLADPPAFWTWDTTSTLHIVMTKGALAAVTDADVYAGANALLVGNEVIQFVNCSMSMMGSPAVPTYTISRLLRGRRNTEPFAYGHSASETVIVIGAGLGRSTFPDIFIGMSESYKAVTQGADPTAVTPHTFTSAGNDLKPASPVHLTGARDGSNNLTIGWTRRTRYGGDWNNLTGGVPLNEDVEAHSLDIMSGVTVLRSIAWTPGTYDVNGNPTAAYSAANQTTDGITPGDPVTVNVYQVSAQVGRGFQAHAII